MTLASVGCLKALPSIDVTYCRAQWSFSPDVKQISGKVTTHFKPTSESINTIDFDLSGRLHVDKIVCHGVEVPFKHQSNKIVITLPAAVGVGCVDSVEIEYHGTPVPTCFGSIGWDKLTNTCWTLSEPYGARDWWPCRQNLTDKIDSMDIYVTCPTIYKAVANGRFIGYTESGNEHTAHYKLRHLINYYTVGLAVGNYEAAESMAELSNGDKVGIFDYYYSIANYDNKNLRRIANFMNFFSDYWIPYPYADEKYGQVCIKGKASFESQTISVLSQTDIGTVAHELAHQWFGNYVTCASWRDVWINEAFATVSELLMIEKYYSDLAIEWKKYTISSALTSKRAIFNADTVNPDLVFDVPTTYNKSAMTLVMLRNEIGAEAFQMGSRAILEKYANGFATINDARQCFEAAADTSLTEFFNNWIYGNGHPIYTVKCDLTESGKTTISLKQTTSHSSVKFYPMHVIVRLEGKDGYKDVRLHHTSPKQDFVVETDFDVENVVFDPESEILCKCNKIGIKAKKTH